MTTSDNQEKPVEDTVVPDVAPEPTPEPTPVPTEAPVVLSADVLEKQVAEATKPARVQVTQVAQKAVGRYEQLLANLEANGANETKTVINSLKKYADNMDPKKPMSPAQGTMHQYELCQTLRYALNTDPDTFKELWQFVLAFAHKHAAGVFSDRYIFRFPDQWQWSEEMLMAHQRLVNIIKLTANPQTRANGLKQVVLGRSMEVGFTNRGQQNILNFYS